MCGSIRKISEKRPARRGTAATEFALVLPLLLLLAFGCCDLGRAIAAYVCVSNSARVGAEYGATHGYTSYTYSAWQSQVAQQATNEAQGSLAFDSTKLAVSVSSVPAASNLYLVTVTTTYPFQMITAWPGLPNQFNVSHSVSMQRFR
jgi:Flp pilus assembly protein TadG